MSVVVASAYSSLADAVAASVAGDILVIDTDQEVTANLTIPAGVSIVRERGAQIWADDDTVSLSVSGRADFGRLRLFHGFGLGKISLSNDVVALPEWWGVRDGSGRDDIAINEAIKSTARVGLTGEYHCGDRILMPYTSHQGIGRALVALGGRARLFASTANKALLHIADSHVTVSGVSLMANAQGITLCKLTPENDAANTSVVNQNHNRIDAEFCGGDYGLILMAGKAIGGAASGCWYNEVHGYWTSNGTAIWFKDSGSADIITSGANCNTFHGSMNGSIGVGVQIDAGGGNRFHIQQENLTKGVKIADQMANGGDNPNNVFHDWHGENVTIHAEINEPTTKFYNSDLDHTRVIGTARETFLDDGKSRSKTVSLTCDSGGTITLDPAYNKLSFQEKDGIMRVSGYLHVASITGSPAGVLHVWGLPKSCLTGVHNRTVGAVAANEINSGSGAAACLCRIIEGTNTLDIFGANDGVLRYLAPYLRTGSNLTVSIEYPVR